MLTRVWPRTAGRTRSAEVTVTNPTDADLVEACLAGDREAFDAIVERHQRQIYRLCYRFAGSHEDAADLAQDVFVRAYKGLRTYHGQASLGTWLYRIGVNVCLSRRGRASVTEPLPAYAEEPRATGELPVDTLLRGERARRVRAAIRQLPRKQRATLILRVYHDLPHEQIARVLGSSVGAVKANFFHALNNLRKRLTDE